MEIPLELAFDGVESTGSLEAEIHERVAKLDALFDRLITCRVRVFTPHRQHRTGNVPEVHIELSVPGHNLMVSHAPHHPEDHAAKAWTPLTAIHDAFDIAERRLKDHKEQISGEVKTHDVELLGQISQLFPQQEYGFLLTNTGNQLYFHRNSLLSVELDQLRIGDPVHYVEAMGDTGPTAKKVRRATPNE